VPARAGLEGPLDIAAPPFEGRASRGPPQGDGASGA